MRKPLICLLIQCSPLWASGSPAERRLTGMGHSENPSPLSWTPRGLQRSWRRPLHKLWGHTRLRWDLGRLRSQLQLLSGVRQVPVPFCTSVLPWKIEIFILTCLLLVQWCENGERAETAVIGPHTRREGVSRQERVCACVSAWYTQIYTRGHAWAEMQACAYITCTYVCTSICRHSHGGKGPAWAHGCRQGGGTCAHGFYTHACLWVPKAHSHECR